MTHENKINTLGLTDIRVATKPDLTSGVFSPPLWTPDLLAWKWPKEPENNNYTSFTRILYSSKANFNMLRIITVLELSGQCQLISMTRYMLSMISISVISFCSKNAPQLSVMLTTLAFQKGDTLFTQFTHGNCIEYLVTNTTSENVNLHHEQL